MAGKLFLVGLGTGNSQDLPRDTVKILKESRVLCLRFPSHPVIKELNLENVEAFEDLFDRTHQLQEGEALLRNRILERARKENVVYAVTGHPAIDGYQCNINKIKADAQRAGIEIQICPAPSIMDSCGEFIEPGDAVSLFSAAELEPKKLHPGNAYLVTGLEWRKAGEHVYHIFLQAAYSSEHVIHTFFFPVHEAKLESTPCLLKDLTNPEIRNRMVAIYFPPCPYKQHSLSLWIRLVEIMACLRGENGCAWDREQTHQSLKKYLIEETCEVLDALERRDMHNLQEELGDLLLQVVFHACIAEEAGYFNIDNVLEGIISKLLRRHPHVFGSVKAETVSQVNENWERIKVEEKDKDQRGRSILEEIPRTFPALLRAQKVQNRVARVGFDWPEISGAWDKLEEELGELRKAILNGEQKASEEELGDLLFAVVNIARFLKVNAEEALNQSIHKFRRRFAYIELKSRETGKRLQDMSLVEMNNYWEEIKKT